ncbi:MAG: AraC family transcriptional regulator, partial [Hyphomicrobiaceae bacterium]
MNRTRAVWANAAYKELKRRRRNATRALEQAELNELAVMDVERWIPFDKEVRFFEAAAEVSGDDCFGVHLVSRIDVRTAGLLAYIGLAARTLDDAFRNFIHYLKVHNAAMRAELVDDGPRVRLKITYLQPALLKYKQRQEMGTTLDLHVARWLTQSDINLVEAQFVHKRGESCDEVERVLGCPVLFGQKTSQTVFHRDDMERPIPTADRELLRVLTRHADQLMDE